MTTVRQVFTRKWMLTHAFVVALVLLFLALGRWQLQRAESGNSLSWAYAMEWPTFALMVVGFWLKIMRDELRTGTRSDDDAESSLRGAGGRDDDDLELAAYNRHIAGLAARRARY